MAAVCTAVVDRCLQRGSTDNITAMLICFQAATSGAIVDEMIDSWFDDINPTKKPHLGLQSDKDDEDSETEA